MLWFSQPGELLDGGTLGTLRAVRDPSVAQLARERTSHVESWRLIEDPRSLRRR